MNTMEKYSAEEVEAMRQEGIDFMSPEAYELYLKYLEINRKIDALNKEKKAIAALVSEEAKQKDAKILSFGGREVFELVKYSTDKIDKDALISKYPQIAAEVIEKKWNTRVDFKK